MPLRYCPLEFELELNDTDQPIINSIYEAFNATNSSLLETRKLHAQADLCTFDDALDNNYVAHALSCKSLSIVYNTIINNIQTILSWDTQFNVSRSLSNLRSVFVMLQRGIDAQSQRNNGINKLWNNFYSPMAQDNITRSTTPVEEGEIESLQLQAGAFMIPQYLIRSHAEWYYNLRKSLGIQVNTMHSIDIQGNEYCNNKFTISLDCEKVLGLDVAGMNTKNSRMLVRQNSRVQQRESHPDSPNVQANSGSQ